MYLCRLRTTITSVFDFPFSVTSSWNWRWIIIASAIVTTLATNSALGQTSPGIDVEYLTRQGVDERLQSDGVDLLGDKVDMNTGSLVFRHTDVAIPGNSGLEVAVHRRRTTGRRYLLTDEFEFADWEIEAPKMTMLVGQIRQGAYLEAAVWNSNRCTEITFPPPKVILPWPFNPFIYQGGE